MSPAASELLGPFITSALAVIRLPTRRPSAWESFLSYLPLIGGAVGLAAFYLFWSLTPRRPRLRLGVVAALGLVLLTVLLRPWDRPHAPGDAMPASTTGSVAWSTFQGNERRSGHADDQPGPPKPNVLWTFREESGTSSFGASPAVAGGRVFVGSDSRTLHCLRADTGQAVWTFKSAAELFASPVIADEKVYLGEGLHETGNAKLYCIDWSSGKKRWEFATSGHIELGPTLRGDRLYFGAGGDGVYCVDARTGRQVWRFAGAHVDLSPVVTDKAVFFGGTYESPSFYCLNPSDGSVIWERPAPTGVCGSPSIDEGRVFFGLGNGTFTMSHATPQGAVYCLSAENGAVLWKTEDVKDAVLTTIALADRKAYFGSRDGHLYCVDAASGRRLWAYDARSPIVSSPAIAAAGVYVGSSDGLIRCLDAASGAVVWEWDTARSSFSNETAILASPVVSEGRLYVGSMNGVFYCVGKSTAAPPSGNAARTPPTGPGSSRLAAPAGK